MKTIPAAVQTALDAETMGFSILVKLTLTNGTVLAFTTSDEPILFETVTYAPGLGEGKVPQKDGLQAPSQKADFLIDSGQIVVDDLVAGIYDHAAIEVNAVQHADPAAGAVKGLKGRLGKVSAGDTLATAEVRGLRDQLRATIGRSFTKACPFDLGDADCKVVLGPFTAAGTVTGVTDDRQFADTSRGEADAFFDLGLLTWTSGLNDTLQMEVKEYLNTGGAFQLVLPMARTVQVGDAYSVYRGCDKTADVCKNVFSNLVNHGGFPFIPGHTQFMKTGKQ